MAKRIDDGHYRVGRIEQKQGGPRPRETETFGVIKGEQAEQNGHLEWTAFCEGSLKTSKWFAYRVGPGGNGSGVKAELLAPADTKKEAAAYLERLKGSQFDEKF